MITLYSVPHEDLHQGWVYEKFLFFPQCWLAVYPVVPNSHKDTKIKVFPTHVHKQMGHPVYLPLEFWWVVWYDLERYFN